MINLMVEAQFSLNLVKAMKVHLKRVNIMEMEFLSTNKTKNTEESSKMENIKELASIHGKMVANTMESIQPINDVGTELLRKIVAMNGQEHGNMAKERKRINLKNNHS